MCIVEIKKMQISVFPELNICVPKFATRKCFGDVGQLNLSFIHTLLGKLHRRTAQALDLGLDIGLQLFLQESSENLT